ncbi:hypothetical protein JCM11641_000043 [Rhodosporidiobolus odoratus]
MLAPVRACSSRRTDLDRALGLNDPISLSDHKLLDHHVHTIDLCRRIGRFKREAMETSLTVDLVECCQVADRDTSERRALLASRTAEHIMGAPELSLATLGDGTAYATLFDHIIQSAFDHPKDDGFNEFVSPEFDEMMGIKRGDGLVHQRLTCAIAKRQQYLWTILNTITSLISIEFANPDMTSIADLTNMPFTVVLYGRDRRTRP